MLLRIFFYVLLFLGGRTSWVAAEGTSLETCLWKDCRSGAMSVTFDDSQVSCLKKLEEYDIKGTFFISKGGITEDPGQHIRRYKLLGQLYRSGHEIGGHSYSHSADIGSEVELRADLLRSIHYIREKTGVAAGSIITMSWPYGSADYPQVAAELFLAARGYGVSELEDPTPADFMNLKALLSPEHGQSPGAELRFLRKMVARAEAEGKWAILVYHTWCGTDRIVDYAAGKDLWIAPLGTVVKYIAQRDRIKVRKISETASEAVFTVYRDSLPVSPVRDFEDSFNNSDIVTFRISSDYPGRIREVLLDGKEVAVKKDGSGGLLLGFPVVKEVPREIRVMYQA